MVFGWTLRQEQQTLPFHLALLDSIVEVYGGGGSGGNSWSGIDGGCETLSSGGAGGVAMGFLNDVTPGSTITATVGNGGPGPQFCYVGVSGGTSSFSTLNATGGAPGQVTITGVGTEGTQQGQGGMGSGGSINQQGGSGDTTVGGSNTRGGGGNGIVPGSVFGGGGGGVTGSIAVGTSN